MKARRSRAISIFSMSALDLFASALGAFILLTVVLLPYFPHTGGSPERVADIRVERDEFIAQETQAKAEAQQLQVAIGGSARNTKLPPIDIVVALDTTGSMDRQVAGLKTDVENLGRVLQAITDSAALGVVEFKDACEGNRAVRTFGLSPVNDANMDRLRGFVQSIFSGNYPPDICNNEQPEAVELALQAAIAQPWRKASRRIIVIATDNPAYPYLQAQTFSYASSFRSQGGKVSTVFVRTPQSLGGTAEYLTQLARSGGGTMTPQGGSFIGAVLVAALR